jgi:predicted ATPase/DNA-binding SARP family transcriptional activator
MLSIHLFGPPRFERDGIPVHVSRRKVVALASYLAQTNQPASRETLAALLWPEHDQSEALKSLRRELARLKRDLGEEGFSATRSHVTFGAEAKVDVIHFQKQLRLVQSHDQFAETDCASCLEALIDAVNLYADDFMAGFNLPDCPKFDAWQDFQRESLRQNLGQALEQLAAWHSLEGKHDRAICYARRRLALDPLNETGRRELMEVYARAGQQAAALRLYDEGAKLLQKELGIAPAEESKRLWQALRAGPVPEMGQRDRAQAKGPEPGWRRRRSHLPRAATPFVGRSQELTMIQLRLQEPTYRLLTVVGPGGIGKTRLALEVGQRIRDASLPLFSDGIFFVPLEAVNWPAQIAAAMMEAARISLYGSEPQEQQLLAHLHDKRMLFILDNLEHLLDGAAFIEAIVAAAPGVRILATSRTALRLQEEWLHPLRGLAVPLANSAERSDREAGGGKRQLSDYDAIRLFVQRAHAVSPTFSLDAEAAHVVRICRLVDGMPLALELAAAWLKVLDARGVADELEQGLDLLDARFRNLPKRHQSIRAVFNQSWALLDQSEQEVLARLSVFQGGFTREAAARVAGATLTTLSDLVDKSLLQNASGGRHRLHELLRQFAEEQLTEMEGLEQSREAHCRYYLACLAQRKHELKGGRQDEALRQIKVDLENVHLAWNWALDRKDLSTIDQALESIFLYHYVRGRNQQGLDFLQSAWKRLAPGGGERAAPVWGRIVSRVSLMASLLSSPGREIEEQIQIAQAVAREHGDRAEVAFCHFVEGFYHTLVRPDVDVAVSAYEQARQVFQDLNETFYLVKVLLWMGFCHGIHSRPDLDFKYTHEALAMARAADQKANVAHALANLAFIAFCIGDYQTAEKYARESGAIGAELNLPSTVAYSTVLLCMASLLKGEVEAAGRLAKEAHERTLEINRPLAVGFALALRALHASLAGDYGKGKAFAETSLAISGSHFGMIMPYWALAVAKCGLKQDGAAWKDALRAMEMASQAGFVGMVTWPLPVMAVVQARAGQKGEAVKLLALAQAHPLSPNGWQRSWPLLTEQRECLKGALGRERFGAAWERGAALDLEATVTALLAGGTTAPAGV